MSRIDVLRESELLQGLALDRLPRVDAIAQPRRLRGGEVLFRLGEDADHLYFVVKGSVDLTFPIVAMGESKDVRFQSVGAPSTLGWSALVPPYQLTMGARARVATELLALARTDLLQLFDEDHRVGYVVMSNLANVIGARLRETQALWVREVQRHVSHAYR